MKVLVPVKQVLDPALTPRISGDSLEARGMKQVINPFDEVALEEALKLKEQNIVSEIIVVSINNAEKHDALRTAFALGADRGICIKTDHNNTQSINVAKLLKALALKEDVKLVLMGKQSSDTDMGTAGQMLAAMLEWPQATGISKLSVSGNQYNVSREIDGGVEELSIEGPCVLTCDLQLNNPRFATLPNIMKARKKEITVVDPSELSVSLSEHFKVLEYTTPAPKKGAEMISSVDAFIAKIQEEVEKI